MKLLSLLVLLVLCTASAWSTPLTLDDCLRLARQNNPELKAARIEQAVSTSRVDEARGGYRPKVDVSAGYTVLRDPQAVIIAGMTEPTQEDRFPFADLKIEQTLYDFGRTRNRVEQASALSSATAEEIRDRTQDILLQTSATYFRVLEAQQLLAAARQEETLVTDHLRIARELYDQGVVTRNDVLQAEVELASSRQRRLKSGSALENAWLQLNYLTGRAAESRGEIATDQSLMPPATDPSRLPDILASLPLLQAARWRVSADEADADASRSALRPTLFAEGRIDYLENEYVEQQTMYSATLGLKFNLYDGSVKRSRLAAAVAREEQQRQNLVALREKAVLAYRMAENDTRVAAKRIEETGRAIEQAEDNLRINRERYRSQVGTASDVLEAQTLLTRSRTEHYQARYDYQIALARLQRALGLLGGDQ